MIRSRAFTLIELLVVIAITISTGFFLLPKLVDFKQDQDVLDQSQNLVSFIKQAQANAISGYQCGDNFNLVNKSLDWHVIFLSNSLTLEPNCSSGVNQPQTTYKLPTNVIIYSLFYDNPNTADPFQYSALGSKAIFSNITGNIIFKDQNNIEILNRSRMGVVLKSTSSSNSVTIYIEKGGGLITTSPVAATTITPAPTSAPTSTPIPATPTPPVR